MPYLRQNHLKQRDKGRPRGRLNFDAQVKLSGKETPKTLNSKSFVCVYSLCVLLALEMRTLLRWLLPFIYSSVFATFANCN